MDEALKTFKMNGYDAEVKGAKMVVYGGSYIQAIIIAVNTNTAENFEWRQSRE